MARLPNMQWRRPARRTRSTATGPTRNWRRSRAAYSTAENLLHRASVAAERVLVTGASGGVGSAAVQLAKRRGARVVAVASPSKADTLRAIGADEVVDRGADLVAAVGRDSIDAVIDLVAGPAWPGLLDVLRRGGRYATAGAIAGPAGRTRRADALSQGSDAHRLHLSGGRGVRKPSRLHRARRNPPARGEDFSPARYSVGRRRSSWPRPLSASSF